MTEKSNPYASPVITPKLSTATDAVIRRLRVPSLGLFLLGLFVVIAGTITFPLLFIGVFLSTEPPTPADIFFFVESTAIILCSYPIVFGSLEMRGGTNYRWAYTAAALACIPFPTPFIFINLPLGIWALIVLHRRDVKEAFAHRKNPVESDEQALRNAG
ncbi:MAG: hypothetical protein ACKVP0_23235 [Pirellulaceae bacterium]